MKKLSILLVAVLTIASAWAQYKPAGDKIKTQWGENINPENVWNTYPRPIMERAQWQNLNGLWNYAITDANSSKPATFDGKILVPFCAESSLSGVGKTVTPKQDLWYERDFTVPANWKNNRILLHFGAVDWKAEVWVNGVKVGTHTGGFTPFEFDITGALKKGNNKLTVKVHDNTDVGYQPRGKQVLKAEGIWYTAVTGIWQTVWLEPVPETHIADLRITPCVDSNTVEVKAIKTRKCPDVVTQVVVKDNGKAVASASALGCSEVTVEMPKNVKLWSPNSPNLYDMEVTLLRDGKVIDKVDSYLAMRKYSTKVDKSGICRMQINNEDIFQYGPLDQGWWPDGLYTAPCYEAMIYDIDKTKEMGFNMIRKHVKVEPATWYAYCDKVGIIVWQDMPSGDRTKEWQMHNYFKGTELERSKESADNWCKEWKEIMDYLYSYPCIGTWVPFNEAWGQFNTVANVEWTKNYDPTRLVNPASGGNHFTCGDILDIHSYPHPTLPLFDPLRATVVGEYGGIGYVVKDHLWVKTDRNWGYVKFNSPKEVTDEYVKYAKILKDLVARGASAAVYTQTTDCETEVNGLLTYDRKVVKVEVDRIKAINEEVISTLNKK